ncbi:NAD-dependent epimerase/dehydratase family protein [Lusitaniella coriacea LEGE 07157]|uniref:NAD-dependent epimerase/dehydratase family protein n=1 Tax=Lusitaniella coriacea LEGE 07157 TaxID=945747 RepID=A0A8J7JCQ3_9CYAN|nr:NAD-dependent epimerase/dehydratase family protein [Lusitaniella coriacea]MBE9117805.1 NAD-dependent epimerase/dehydratase family protein [Lusitaniella coriacea LEGE 07157]
MKILVTGATGFLGTTLCAKLEEQEHELTRLNSKNCDLTQQDALLQFKQPAYDRIYHLAAWTQAGDFCLYHPGEQWIINQQINTNVLTWWQQHQPQAKLICMGTSCAYAPDMELVEENYLNGLPIESLFTYAMTKRMLYAGLLALHKQFGLKYLCLVPSTLYGPGYHTDGRQMHFIFDLIRKIIRGKLYGEPVILWGDGYQSRELVFVEDFAQIATQLADSVDNELINIGAGEEFPIRHFAKLICDRVNYDFNAIQFDTSRYVGAKSKCLAVGKLQHCLPDLQLTPLEVGLSKTIDWFWQEQEKLLPAN